jgi:hypothetical protein
MKTTERCPTRPCILVTFAMLGALAFSGLSTACAAPTDQDGAASDTQSEALANNGGGGTSTCESRMQSCYVSCSVIYQKDPKTAAQCLDLCDEIYSDCTNEPATTRPVLPVVPIHRGPVEAVLH